MWKPSIRSVFSDISPISIYPTKRKAIGDKDYLNSKELYAPFKDIDIATLEDINTGQRIKKAVALPSETIQLFEKINKKVEFQT